VRGAAVRDSLQPLFLVGGLGGEVVCGAAALPGTILSNLRADFRSSGVTLVLRQIWQVWIVGEPLRFRLLCGFVRFPVGLRLFLNPFCRLFRLNEVMRS